MELVKFNEAYRAIMVAKTIDEVKEIHDKAEALRLYVRQQGQGLQMQNACAEIKIRAERRAGEMLAEMERGQTIGPGRGKTKVQAETSFSEYAAALAGANVSRTTAYRWQTIASLPDENFEEEIAVIKNDNREITSSKILQRARQYLMENTPSPPPVEGKYRVIYADPPWKYGNIMPDYATEQADHYPLKTIKEIAGMSIKDIAEDNAVLFLWVTSPILEEAFEVINTWGFKYKASFVWDKVRHNMGHYNSVRHEFLLICTRGSCLPDVNKLFDSVQEIERSNKHSEKPEQFRKIIDTLYPNGNRIELFARREVTGWTYHGNELLP